MCFCSRYNDNDDDGDDNAGVNVDKDANNGRRGEGKETQRWQRTEEKRQKTVTDLPLSVPN